MSKTYESGHAINVANFEDLISFCTGYGAAFKPSNAAISLAALGTRHTACKGVMAAVNAAIPANTNAINNREIVFAPLTKLVTRIPYAVAASDASTQVVDDVKTIIRKLQGKRATPKKQDDPATPENESEASHSASQMSFDNRIENMDKLIQLLTSITGYAPNEIELTVAELTKLLGRMKTANSTAINAYTPVSNARILRNTELYHPETGLVAIANKVKTYIKSAFGLSSPQYKQVSKLKFKTIIP